MMFYITPSKSSVATKTNTRRDLVHSYVEVQHICGAKTETVAGNSIIITGQIA